MPTNQPENESSYIIDAESAAEMARLMVQDRLTTKAMGGLFSERSDNLASVHDILDIACGPGGWVLDVAHAYPEKQVVGIDISRLMMEYARAQAKVQWLENASFHVMDALKPLDFSDNSFDLVNARLLFGFMPPTAWPGFLQECKRILRPGGIIRLSEAEWPITNGLASEKLAGMVLQALHSAGKSFSPDGRHVGITPMLSRLLRDAGYHDVQKMASVNDFSAGMEAHAITYQDLMAAYKLLQPFLIKMDVTTQVEVDELYQQMLDEMISDDFCAVAFLVTAWGTRPL